VGSKTAMKTGRHYNVWTGSHHILSIRRQRKSMDFLVWPGDFQFVPSVARETKNYLKAITQQAYNAFKQ
jgi:hypothetical protein